MSARGLDIEWLERRDLLSAPELMAFTRLIPSGSLTSADVLTIEAKFNKAVTSVNAADFAADGTTGAVTDVAPFIDSVPNGPSIVSVEPGAYRVFMQKREPDGSLSPPQAVVVRGVSWAPTSRGTTETTQFEEFVTSYERDIPLMASMGVNVARVYQNLGLGDDGLRILDEFYRNGISVIMTVNSGQPGLVVDLNHIEGVVRHYESHPAILMWAVGNEWDLNHYYGAFNSLTEAAAFTEQAASLIKSIDQDHPVSTFLVDLHNEQLHRLSPEAFPLAIGTSEPPYTSQIVNDMVPSIDVWGFNIYRGNSFQDALRQWETISREPLLIGEYGVDSFDQRIGAENETYQSDVSGGLWDEIYFDLSGERTDGVAIGGLIHEFADNWWQDGQPGTHNFNTGDNYGKPDGFDREWFGTTDIDRNPKLVYGTMRNRFALGADAVVATPTPLLRASSSYVAQFEIGDKVVFSRGGGGHGARGINVGVLDPNTGLRMTVRSFDTWLSSGHFGGPHVHFQELIDYLDSLPNGAYISLAIGEEGGFVRYDNGEPWDDPYVESAYQALEALGSTEIRNVEYWGGWAMIAVKGKGKLAEGFSAPHEPVTIVAQASLTLNLDANRRRLEDIVGRHPNGGWYVASSTGATFVNKKWGSWATVPWADVQEADVNGDGLSDMVGRHPNGGWYVAKSTGTSFVDEKWGTWATVPWADVEVADVNGDGRSDIVGRHPNGSWYVAKSTGTNFIDEKWATWARVDWLDVRVGDFNGDRRDDIAGRHPDGSWHVARSTGTSFITSKWASWATVDWADIRVGDFNGDRRDDIAGRHPNGGWYVAKSTGTGFVNEKWTSWATVDWADVRVGDFNGDGHDDIAGRHPNGGWYVSESTGVNFGKEKWTSWATVDWTDVQVADANGDGRSDIVGRHPTGGWYVAKSTGNGFVNKKWTSWARVAWVDVNVGHFDESAYVEDYHVDTTKGRDYGDAPVSYATLAAANGARHLLSSPLFLGAGVDSENNGQPNATATGDDVAGTPDDENGVTFNAVIPGRTSNVNVVVSVGGKLDAFLDFNADGDFTDPGEKIFNSVVVVAGTNVLSFVVPSTAKIASSLARFRLSSGGGLSFTGLAADGEVEDYRVDIIQGRDYVDAPDSYATLAASNGARHLLDSPLFLAARVISDFNYFPLAEAARISQVIPIAEGESANEITLTSHNLDYVQLPHKQESRNLTPRLTTSTNRDRFDLRSQHGVGATNLSPRTLREASIWKQNPIAIDEYLGSLNRVARKHDRYETVQPLDLSAEALDSIFSDWPTIWAAN